MLNLTPLKGRLGAIIFLLYIFSREISKGLWLAIEIGFINIIYYLEFQFHPYDTIHLH